MTIVLQMWIKNLAKKASKVLSKKKPAAKSSPKSTVKDKGKKITPPEKNIPRYKNPFDPKDYPGYNKKFKKP